jgi:hypothetical protein
MDLLNTSKIYFSPYYYMNFESHLCFYRSNSNITYEPTRAPPYYKYAIIFLNPLKLSAEVSINATSTPIHPPSAETQTLYGSSTVGREHKISETLNIICLFQTRLEHRMLIFFVVHRWSLLVPLFNWSIHITSSLFFFNKPVFCVTKPNN